MGFLFEKLDTVYFHNKLLFGSIRFIGNNVYLFTVPYKDELNYHTIQLKVDSIPLDLINIEKNEGGESVVILSYSHPMLSNKSSISVHYSYGDLKGVITLEKLQREKKKLVAMTLFLYDYQLLDAYISHYIHLGVQEFFFYFNGYLSQLINSAKDFINYLHRKWADVTTIHFIECSIVYWDSNVKSTPHCAQVIAINDFLYQAKAFYDFIIMNDLDEYFYLKDDFVLEAGKSYVIENKYALTGGNYFNMLQMLSTAIRVNKKSEGVNAVKMILHPKTINIAGVHRPPFFRENLTVTNPEKIFHAHCIDYRERDRSHQFRIENFDPIVLSSTAKFIIS